MSRPPSARTLVLLAGILVSGSPAPEMTAQPEPAPPAAPPTLQEEPIALGFSDTSSVSWVLVPVVVRRPPGREKPLLAADFELRVDGQPVPIVGFEATSEAPIALVFLQDLSGSMANGGRLEASRQAVRIFLERTRPGDVFSLMTFASGRTELAVPFTRQPVLLEAALDGWRGHGTTALYDAVARLPELRIDDRSLRRAAVLITDGADNASVLDPAEARRIVREAELPVYVLWLGRAAPRAIPGSISHLLRLLALATGGRYHEVGGPDSFKEACIAISDQLRQQYLLSFPTRPTGPEAYREIRVRVDTKTLDVSHRRGYVGRAPADSRPLIDP